MTSTPVMLSPVARHTICAGAGQSFPVVGSASLAPPGPQTKMRSASVISAPLPGIQDGHAPAKLLLPPDHRNHRNRSSSISSVSDTPGHRFTFAPLELSESRGSEPSEGEINRLQKAGKTMQRDQLVARWMSTRRKDFL